MLFKVLVYDLQKAISSQVMILTNDTNSFKMTESKVNGNELWKTVTTRTRENSKWNSLVHVHKYKVMVVLIIETEVVSTGTNEAYSYNQQLSDILIELC